MRKYSVLTLVAFATILFSACGGKPTPQPVTYTIEMSEYAFNPAKIEVQVGQQVTLELVNKGALEHEILFGRDVVMTDGHPSGYQQDMFAAGGVEPKVTMKEGTQEGASEEEEPSGFRVNLVKTGDTASMTFTVTKGMVGEWEMGCFELDGVHYTSGMKGTFIVNP